MGSIKERGDGGKGHKSTKYYTMAANRNSEIGRFEWRCSRVRILTCVSASHVEPFALIVVSAVNFAAMLRSSVTVPSTELTNFVAAQHAAFPQVKFLSFAIWGASEYYAEEQNARNREFQARAVNDATKVQQAYVHSCKASRASDDISSAGIVVSLIELDWFRGHESKRVSCGFRLDADVEFESWTALAR